MRARVVLFPLLTLIGVASALELTARRMSLDDRQRQAVRVERSLWIANMPGSIGAAWGVDYLPRGFSIDEGGFTSGWGRCDYAHPGRTALVFGDSVTRQVNLPPGPGALPDDPAYTWPGLLQGELGEDWQLCVIAEDGYHPSDYAAMARVIVPKLEPELLLVQLCENDLVDVIAPEPEPLPTGGVALYAPVTEHLAFAPLYWPPLFTRSEAARFVHWRLQARFGRTERVPVDRETHRSLAAALQTLDGYGARVFYVPRLEEPPKPADPESWRRLTASGVEVVVLDLPAPRTRLRHAHDDPVHLNRHGHRAVLEALKDEVLADGVR